MQKMMWRIFKEGVGTPNWTETLQHPLQTAIIILHFNLQLPGKTHYGEHEKDLDKAVIQSNREW